jgi:hypothetical protein
MTGLSVLSQPRQLNPNFCLSVVCLSLICKIL